MKLSSKFIMAVVILFVGFVSWRAMAGSGGGYSNITPEEVNRRLTAGEKLQIIDVREPFEFAEGRIPGSVLIPLGQLELALGALDPQAEIIVVCRSDNRSAQASQLMASKGFKKVKNMVGGMKQWTGAVEK